VETGSPAQNESSPEIQAPPVVVSQAAREEFDQVESEVNKAEHAIAGIRKNLLTRGDTLNGEINSDAHIMDEDLEKAKRYLDNGNEAAAKEELRKARALAARIRQNLKN
jgi:hypothetical protein